MLKGEEVARQKEKEAQPVKEIPQAPSHLFFMANEALKPPYSVSRLLSASFK
jgi:U3 small nucleolar RNA-associated protein 24